MKPDVTASAPSVLCTAVTKTFGSAKSEVAALAQVDLQLAAGTTTAIVGPSGCGKSTLLRIIAGLEKATGGRVDIDGQPPEALRSRGDISVGFQDAALLPWRSVESNIALGMRLARRPKDSRRVQELIQMVGLEGFERARPSQLSGGMRQRAAIARCLAPQPRLLLLDEPFGAVDELTRRRLNVELPASWTSQSATTLLVTHSIAEAVFLSDSVAVMGPRPGRIVTSIEIDLPRPRIVDHLHSTRFFELVNAVAETLGVDAAPTEVLHPTSA